MNQGYRTLIRSRQFRNKKNAAVKANFLSESHEQSCACDCLHSLMLFIRIEISSASSHEVDHPVTMAEDWRKKENSCFTIFGLVLTLLTLLTNLRISF